MEKLNSYDISSLICERLESVKQVAKRYKTTQKKIRQILKNRLHEIHYETAELDAECDGIRNALGMGD